MVEQTWRQHVSAWVDVHGPQRVSRKQITAEPTVPAMSCRDKVVIVTGAGMISERQHGIGSSIALALAENGAVVWACDRDPVRLAATAAAVGTATGQKLNTHVVDVTDEAGTQAMAAACASRCGRVDGLVNVVGVTMPYGLLETTAAQWRTAMEVNATSQFLCARACMPHMLRAGGGSVVNVSSVSGLRALRAEPAYAASKGAVNSLTTSIALEFAGRGVRCNALAPGLIRTPLVEAMIRSQSAGEVSPEALAAALATRDASSPTGAMGRPVDCAALAVFLISDAARYVNATLIPVDGGLSMRGKL